MDAITKSRKPKPSPDRGVKLRAELEVLTEQAAAAARMLKLLGNEHRLLILCFLIAQGEMRVGDLVDAVGLSQSALSQHLALLREDGLVAFRRESQTLYYRVCDPRAARILKLLKDLYCGDLA
jgi:DNA-binding transcriptional ArsR family regulator